MALTHDEIARVCHCEAVDVESWEAGASAPTFVQLRALAEKCKRPLASLFLPDPPKVAEPPPEYRTLHSSTAKHPSYNTVIAIRTALYVQEITARLDAALEEQGALSLPHLQSSDDPEKAGADFRTRLNVTVEDQRKWHSDYQAVRVWRSHIEECAVTTLQLPFPMDDGRGFSLYDQSASVVVINSKDAPRARCFTLFHEVAHLCLRRSGVFRTDLLYDTSDGYALAVEVFCNRFAAAALVPTDDAEVDERLRECVTDGSLDEERLQYLANLLRVSRFVILRRLLSLGRLSMDQVQAVEAGWLTPSVGSKGGSRSTPVRKCLNQRGQRFVSTVLEAFAREYISYGEVSDYLSLKVKHLDALRQAVGGS